MTANPYQTPVNTVDSTEQKLVSARIRQISFLSTVIIGGCFGFAIGLLGGMGILVANLFWEIDINFPESMGSVEMRGFFLGVIALVFLPLHYAVVVALLSIPAYFPFQLAIRLVGRWIRLSAIVEYDG